MTATGKPPLPPPARPPEAGAPVPPSTRLARDDLRALFKRYYVLLGFTVKEQDGRIDVFEASSSSPAFSYVFDRKTYSRNQDAKLVTFNSPELGNIIDTINSRGKVARAYIPFEFDPKVEFQRAIEQIQAKASSTGGFVNNGTIHLVKHYIGYVPFLMFITRIDFSSVDASTEIERVIIPLIDQGKLPDTIKHRIENYIDKLGKFFDSEHSHLVNHMPVAGELLEIPDEQIEALVDEATPKLQENIKSRTSQVEGKLQARLQKEIGILENYYKQLTLETASAIEVAREKRDKGKTEELEQSLASIEKEQKFKTAEYQSIYRLSTQFEVLGAAAVYVPIFFQFLCKIKSVYGDIDCTLDYNIFDKEVIPPTCTCGNTIYQGHVCSNLHFSCMSCTGICAECKADICSGCKPKRCKHCNDLLCSAHTIECDCCVGEGIENRWTCKLHSRRCDLCGKTTCRDCRDTCKECGRVTCVSCGIYKCKSCGKVLCSEHAHECVRCLDADANKRWSCGEHTRICAFCGGNICMECAYTCSTCKKSFCEVCEAHKCRICGSTTCKDHSHECPSCAEDGEKNSWVCDSHILKCDFCNLYFCAQCVDKCAICGKTTCKICGIHTCQTCGKHLCKDHSVTCSFCEAEKGKNPDACPDHAVKCDFCGQYTCKQHMREKCSVCGKSSCLDCESFKCKVCRQPVCKLHVYECSRCKKNYFDEYVCKAHLARCHSCGKDICVSCISQCAQCGRISCNDCSSIKCKQCGKNLCQDHAVACDKCKEVENDDPWSCADHVVTCDICKRHLCLKCEPDIARCNVCGKAICSDCQPHYCKDCNKTTCDQHHGECSACKNIGRSAVETCADHTYTCTACKKVICKEHSVVCTVCQNIFCTGDTCSAGSGDACLTHSFISARDGSRHSVQERIICESCHLAYTSKQMYVSTNKMYAFVGSLCATCKDATKDKYYLYMRRSGKVLAFPDFLDMPGDDKPVIVVTLNDRPFKITTKQQGVSMAENELALIFFFNSRGGRHTLVHVKDTGFEILYTRPGVGGQIKGLVSKSKIAPEVVLTSKPALIDASPPIPRSNQVVDGVHADMDLQAELAPGMQEGKRQPSTGQVIRVKVQKLFKASIRIKLDMLRRVLEMEQLEFSEKITDCATENGLTIENGHVLVATSDIDKFLERLDSFLLSKDHRR